MSKTTTAPKEKVHAVLIEKGKARLKGWERAEGMWEHRKPDPIKELNKMHKEMDRKLPYPPHCGHPRYERDYLLLPA